MAPEPDKRKTRNASAKDKKADQAKAADSVIDIVNPQEDLQILEPQSPPVPQGGANRDPPPIVDVDDQPSLEEGQQHSESSSDASMSSSEEEEEAQGPGGIPMTDQQKMDWIMTQMRQSQKTVEKMKKKRIQDKLKYKTALKQAFRTSPAKQHIQLPAAHSRVQMKVPKMAQGQSYTEYLAEVKLWRQLSSIPKTEQAYALIMELPTTDKFGGLRQILVNRLKPEIINHEDGVNRMITELDRIIKQPSFVRLLQWNERFERINQKTSEPLEGYLERLRSLRKEAEDDFNFRLPAKLVAAKMLAGIEAISGAQIAILTQDIDLERDFEDKGQDEEFITQVENVLRKFVATQAGTEGTKKAGAANKIHAVDVLGNRMASSGDDDEDGHYGVNLVNNSAAAAAKKEMTKFGQVDRKPGESNTTRSERLKAERRCLHCAGVDHFIDKCPRHQKFLTAKRKHVEATGGTWDKNRPAMKKKRDETGNGQGQGGSSQGNSRHDDTNTVNFNFSAGRQPDSTPPRRVMVYDDDDLLLNINEEDRLYDLDTDSNRATNYVTFEVPKVDHQTVLFTKKDQVLTKAILDSGCQRSVSGNNAMDSMVRALSKEDREEVKIFKSDAKFKFGDGVIHSSLGTWRLPIYIGGRKRYILMDVVDSQELPPLLSLSLMKNLGLTISYNRHGADFALVDGKEIILHNQDGHHWISTADKQCQADIIDQGNNKEVFINSYDVLITAVKPFSEGNEETEVRLLHARMSHPPKERMIAVLKSAGAWSNPEVRKALDKAYKECLTKACRTRGEVQKPGVASFRTVREVGDLVSIDLKIRSGEPDILYLVDACSSFCVSAFVDSKSPNEIAEQIMTAWYGASLPRIKVCLSDNRLEFCGEVMERFFMSMGTLHITTPPYTPSSNGQCERVHALVDLNMAKLRDANEDMDDEQCRIWATYAYNQSEMKTGYSPVQLVFGTADNLTSLAEITPPEAEEQSPGLRFVSQQKMRLEALQNHLKIKNSHKIRQLILRKSVPSATKKAPGTWVWIKRHAEWWGPGIVASTITEEAQVKIGARYYGCRHGDMLPLNQAEMDKYVVISSHPQTLSHDEIMIPGHRELEVRNSTIMLDTISMLQEQPTAADMSSAGRHVNTQAESTELQPRPDNREDESLNEVPETDSPADSSCDDEGSSPDTSKGNMRRLDNDKNDENSEPESISEESCDLTNDSNDNNDHASTHNSPITEPQTNTNSSTDTASEQEDLELEEHVEEEPLSAIGRFSKGDKLQLTVDGTWNDVWIRGRDLKSGNPSKYRYSFENQTAIYSADFDTHAWQYRPATSYMVSQETNSEEEMVNIYHTVIPHQHHNRPGIDKAKQAEIEALNKFNTFEAKRLSELTSEQKTKIIPSTWVIVWKGSVQEGRYKARLCARGDKEPNPETIRTDSPTVNKNSLRLLLTLATTHKTKIQSIDFSSAFVQGVQIDREVYLQPPPDIRKNNPDLIWLVKKRLYGFRDASRAWWQEIHSALISRGMTQSKYDKALYFKYKNGKLNQVAALHVDDLLNIEIEEEGLLDFLSQKYAVSKREIDNFTFTGWDLSTTEDSIKMTQENYIRNLDTDGFESLKEVVGNPGQAIESLATQNLMRTAIGVIGWVYQISRPDLGFNYVDLATRLGKSTVADAKEAHRILKKIKKDPKTITYQDLGDPRDWKLVAYCDASLHNLNRFDSVVADVIMLTGNDKACVLDWQSSKTKIPVNSTLEAESQAAVNSYGKLMYIKAQIAEITGFECEVLLRTDNKSLMDTVYSTTSFRDKRTGLAIATLRSAIDEQLMEIQWVNTRQQVANALTKKGANPDLLMQLLNKGTIPEHI